MVMIGEVKDDDEREMGEMSLGCKYEVGLGAVRWICEKG